MAEVFLRVRPVRRLHRYQVCRALVRKWHGRHLDNLAADDHRWAAARDAIRPGTLLRELCDPQQPVQPLRPEILLSQAAPQKRG